MDGKIIIGTDIDTKSFDAQIDYVKSQLDEIEDKLKKADMGFEVGDTQKLEAEYEKLTQKLNNLVKKKEEFNKQDFSNIKGSIKSVGDGIENATKKIGRWALAIFGIRSAINFIKSSVSTLSQYDDQMAINIEYIRYLLASTLKPVIETLIQLAYKLLAYVNYIAQAWFGINLFANASTKAFEKQHTTMKSTNKQAKELQKTLAGFDEMNVLQKSGDVTSGGGGGGVSLPNFPKMEDIQIPKWVQWIANNKSTILSIISGITSGILAWKLGLGGIKALGIGTAVYGIVKAIQNLIKFLKDPTFENFIGILDGITIAIIGIAVAIGAWPVAIGAVIAYIILQIVKNYDKIIEIFKNLIKWFDTKFLGALRDLFGPIGDILYLPIKFVISAILGLFEGLFGGIKKVIDGIVKIFRGDFKTGIKTIFDGLIKIMTAPLNAFIEGVKGLWNQIKKPFENLVSKINNTLKGINPIKISTTGVVSSTGVGSIGNALKSIFGKFGFAKGGIVVPKLASGGIINNPGRGVPLGSAIGGERGVEGVIPLTDSQQMMLLGEAIGRYITINANITNTMNGRIISRELQKVQNDSNFAFNR